ncbi:MAG: PKD domain-containing protein [Bacteroidota bacterium]
MLSLFRVSGQDCSQPNAQFDFPLGTTQFCEGAIVEIRNLVADENPVACVDFMILKWGDGIIDSFPDYDNKIHVYDISDSLACASDLPPEYEIEMTVVYKNGNRNRIIKVISIFPKPVANFFTESPVCPSPIPLCMMKEACWDSLWNWSVRPLAGGPVTNYSEEQPCHPFAEVGSYEVTLIASNICPVDNMLQSDTARQTVQVIEAAQANAIALDGVLDPTADTLVVCLGGGGKVNLNGDSLSTNETSYIWDALTNTRNYDWMVDPPSQDNPVIGAPAIVFIRPGVYQVVLTVNNACDLPSSDTLIFRVEDAAELELVPQEDVCDSLVYQPVSPNDGVTYTINGNPVDNSSFPLTLRVDTFTVVASLVNECGRQMVTDVFIVGEPEQVAILSPRDTNVCVGTDPIFLEISSAGGDWDGPVVRRGDSIFFDPVRVGNFELTYGKGEGSCRSEASITIRVEGIDVAANDYLKCSWSAPFLLEATPGNGAWSSTDCPGCVVNDTFLISEMLSLGLTEVELQYVVSSSIGCEGRGTITVRLSDPMAIFAIPDTICAGDDISPDVSSAMADQTEWRIDGSPSEPPPFENLAAGDHLIEMVAIVGECRDSSTQSVNITQPPAITAFSVSPLEGCAILGVVLSASGTGDNLSFEWFLDDSLVSTSSTPDTLFLGQGFTDTTYTIGLQIGNGCGGEDLSEIVTVFPQPIANFGTDSLVYCSGEAVRFMDASLGNPDTLKWDFGRGVTFVGSDPPDQLFFADSVPIIYPIQLIAINECGSDTLVKTITINPTDVEAFISTHPTEVCLGDTICFESFSTPNAGLQFDFGDGNRTTQRLACHVFRDTGRFRVTLKAFGCGFDSTFTIIRVLPRPTVTLPDDRIICPNDTIQFRAATENVGRFVWTFGDGTGSAATEPTHAYPNPGTYVVRLEGIDVEGCSQTDSMLVTVLDPPDAIFEISTDSLCTGEPLRFSNQSSADVISCFWDFGNGQTSNDCAPVTSYADEGSYQVRLIVTNANGCMDTLRRLVNVFAEPTPDFEIEILEQCTPARVLIRNNTTNAQSYEWVFGNGQNSSAVEPGIITYSGGGTFDIQLIAINGFCTRSIRKTVTIYQKPEPLAALSVDRGCPPLDISLDAIVAGQDLSYLWRLDTLATRFDSSLTYTFQEPGLYDLQLIVSSPFCRDSISRQLEVFEPVEASATPTDNLCFGDELGEIDLTVERGTAPFQFDWSNGSGTEDQNRLAAGLYEFRITDSNNCTFADSIRIAEPAMLVASLVDSAVATCFGDSDAYLCLEASGGVGDYQIEWAAGSREACIENIPAGNYPVLIRDANGCERNFTFEALENRPIQFIDRAENISCFGRADGLISLDSITGGVSDFYNTTLTGPDNRVGGRQFFNLIPGNYQLTVQDLEGCTLTKDYAIGEPDSLWLNILPDTIRMGLGDSVQIESAHNAFDPLLDWLPPTGLSCTNCENPIASPQESNLYTLFLTDAAGCMARDSVWIFVDANRDYYIPNAFTPNGDNRNDRFRIRSRLASIRQIRLFRVYDRWGGLIFEATNFRPQIENPVHAWDGTFRGEPLPPDTFVYYLEIEYIDSLLETVKGTVTLIR